MKKHTKKSVTFIFNNRPAPEVLEEIRASHPDHLADIEAALARCPEPEPEAAPRAGRPRAKPKPRATKPKPRPTKPEAKGKGKKGKRGKR